MANLYRLVLDSIPTAAIVVDKNLKVRYANRAFREFFSSPMKEKGGLKDAVGCQEQAKTCGAGIRDISLFCRGLRFRHLGGHCLAGSNAQCRLLRLYVYSIAGR